jgi:hypothetical protein
MSDLVEKTMNYAGNGQENRITGEMEKVKKEEGRNEERGLKNELHRAREKVKEEYV